jgi:hypothetical protein
MNASRRLLSQLFSLYDDQINFKEEMIHRFLEDYMV